MPRVFRSRSERVHRLIVVASSLIAVVGLLLPGATPAQQPEAELPALLDELGKAFEVLPLSDGYVLEPRAADSPVRLFEIRGGTVIADGEALSARRVRRLVGDDLALALADLAALTTAPERLAAARAGLVRPLAPSPESSSEPAVEIETPPVEIETPPAEIEVAPATGSPAAEERGRPARRRTESLISFGSGARVAEDESAAEVVVLLGKLEMLGEVRGDAVVVGGSAVIDGPVDGNVVAVGGSVSLGAEAAVDGDVVSVGGGVEQDPGARVRGSVSEISLGGVVPDDFQRWRRGFGWPGFWGGTWDVFDRVTNAVLLALVSLLIVVVARRSVESVAARAQREPWRAGLIGLAAQVVVVPLLFFVSLVLLVSIIGIPLLLLIPLACFVFLLALLLGYAGVALACGRALAERFAWARGGTAMVVILGVVLLQLWAIAGAVLSGTSGPIWLLAFLLGVVGFVVKYLAWTVGLGSVLLHKLSPLPATATAGAALPPPLPPPDAPEPKPFEPLLFDDPHAEEDETYAAAGREDGEEGASGDPDADSGPRGRDG